MMHYSAGATSYRESDPYAGRKCSTDPERWSLTGVTPTKENWEAYDLCHSCPALRYCFAVAIDKHPKSVLEGATFFDEHGNTFEPERKHRG